MRCPRRSKSRERYQTFSGIRAGVAAVRLERESGPDGHQGSIGVGVILQDEAMEALDKVLYDLF